jgi:hypothetical protein
LSQLSSGTVYGPRPVRVTVDKLQVLEGDDITFTVLAPNTADSTVYYWTRRSIRGTVDQFDFGQPSQLEPQSGTLTIVSGKAQLTSTVRYDTLGLSFVVEGPEVFILEIRTGSTSGTVIARSPLITITDVSDGGIPYGSFFQGGYNMGRPENSDWLLILAPKSLGQSTDLLQVKTSATATAGTESQLDGLANTLAMDDSNHPAARYALDLNINGYSDWYLPSVDEAFRIANSRITLPQGEGMNDGLYALSTQSSIGATLQRAVNFSGGNIISASDVAKTTGFVTRAVRRVPTSTGLQPTSIGQLYKGGYYAGIVTVNDISYYILVSPNDLGQIPLTWKTSQTNTAGDYSTTDGFSNTYNILNTAEHPAANWVANRDINGYTDWYLPAIDELEIIHSNNDLLPPIAKFATTGAFFYWSSNQATTSFARAWDFLIPQAAPTRRTTSSKIIEEYARAVRREPVIF